jgi:general secretion pathway protein A
MVLRNNRIEPGNSSSSLFTFGRNECENLFGFFGLPENPFGVNPNPRYLFFTQWVHEALTEIPYAIRNRKGLILLTGEAGTGKTTLIHSILGSLHQQKTPTAFVLNSRLEVTDLFDFILAEFGIQCRSEPESNTQKWIYQWLIDRYRTGKTPVLIVDEGQGLPESVLEEIGLLLNLETARETLLQIVLAGQPELVETLKQPGLHQLRQRISYHCKTAPLNLEQTHGYIRERLRIAGARGGLVFVSEAIDAVHCYSQGIPRVVNLLCEHALINAYVDGVRPVPARVVEEVATEFQLGRVEPFSPAYTSYSTPDGGLDSKRSPDFQAPIRSPAGGEAIFEGPCPMASPESSSIAVSSLNVPAHERALIMSSEKNGERASDAIVPVRTSSIISTAEADASPAPITYSAKVDPRKLHDLSPVSVPNKVAAPGEPAPQPPKAGAREQSSIRRVKRIPILSARRSLVRWWIEWRDRSLPFLGSKAWRRMAAFLLLWLGEPIGTVHWCQVKPLVVSHLSLHRQIAILPARRSLGLWLPQWRDKSLTFLRSKAWRRIAAFLLLWLREPIGTVHWCQVKPLVIPAAWTRTTKSLLRRLRQPLH